MINSPLKLLGWILKGVDLRIGPVIHLHHQKAEQTMQLTEKQIDYCMECGVCTGSCPVNKVLPTFSPRQMIKKALRDPADDPYLDPGLWACLGCARCSSRCPVGNRLSPVCSPSPAEGAGCGESPPGKPPRHHAMCQRASIERPDPEPHRLGRRGRGILPKPGMSSTSWGASPILKWYSNTWNCRPWKVQKAF